MRAKSPTFKVKLQTAMTRSSSTNKASNCSVVDECESIFLNQCFFLKPSIKSAAARNVFPKLETASFTATFFKVDGSNPVNADTTFCT